MKKSAIVIADIQLGGGQRSALNLANALSKDHEVTLIVFHTVDQQYEVPYRLVNIECPDKFNVVGKAYNVLKRAYKLRRHFQAEQYDYIFGFMETANFPTAIASSKSILSVHCNPHELEEKVTLTGSQANPFTYLKGAEFLVLSSRTEAFPMVLIESLVLSCPVVATDCPTGPREIVIENENGLLVENQNADALSAAMDRLYSDKQLLAHCRGNALSSVQHLAADKVVKEWLAVDTQNKPSPSEGLLQES